MEHGPRCRMAMQILHATDDGNCLKSNELQLVEDAVNGFLNKAGYEVFVQLYKRVIGEKNVPG